MFCTKLILLGRVYLTKKILLVYLKSSTHFQRHTNVENMYQYQFGKAVTLAFSNNGSYTANHKMSETTLTCSFLFDSNACQRSINFCRYASFEA